MTTLCENLSKQERNHVREARQGGLTPHRGRYGTTVGRGGLTGRTRTPGGTTYNGGRLPPPRLEAGRTTTTGG
jgi:hypothetical protein